MRNTNRGGASTRARTSAGAVAVLSMLALAGHASGQCEEGWDDRFTLPAVPFPVQSMAWTHEGGSARLFVSGYGLDHQYRDVFGSLCWDGSAWGPLPGGLSGDGFSAVRFAHPSGEGGPLHAYGSLLMGGEPFANLASWDGVAWTGVAAPGSVELAVPGPTAQPGSLTVIARTDDERSVWHFEDGDWTALAAQVDDVQAMLWLEGGAGPRLFVLGGFESFNGEDISYGAVWDGTHWGDAGEGLASGIATAATLDTGAGPVLYGATLGEFFRWEGDRWSELAHDGAPYRVRLLGAADLGRGPRLLACGDPYDEISRLWVWDGAEWEAASGEIEGTVLAMAAPESGGAGQVCIGGQFVTVGGASAVHAAEWDGRSWRGAGTSKPGKSVRGGGCLLSVGPEGGELLGNRVYVGGRLSLNGRDIGSAASWDGVRWVPLGLEVIGSSGFVNAMILADLGEGPRVIVAGDLWGASGEHNWIAQWDGREWSSVGPSGAVWGEPGGLAVLDEPSGPTLYACAHGYSDLRVYGERASIARLQDGEWDVLVPASAGRAEHVAVFDGGYGPALYACGGGGFDFGQGRIGPVIKREGDAWVQVGQTLFDGGEIGYAQRLMPINVDGLWRLAIRGEFQIGGEEPGIAVLDGAAWRPGIEFLPHRGVNVRSVETAAGVVTVMDGFSPRRISVQEGREWRTLPGEPDGYVRDLAVGDSNGSLSIYACGTFEHIDDLASDGFARFGCAACPADFDQDGDADADDFAIFLSDWALGGLAADINDDGAVDTRDLVGFLNRWNAGC